MMTADDVRQALMSDITASGLSQTKYARSIGVSQALVSGVLQGTLNPGAKILRRLGLEKTRTVTTTYRTASRRR